MNESLCARLFKLAAESNLEIQLRFVPTTTGPLVVLKVYEIPKRDKNLSDCLANEHMIPLYDHRKLTHLSDDRMIERFKYLIEQIRKARVEKEEK